MKPPARPSEHMLKIYDDSIHKQGLDISGDWAILGCTPEFRTMAGQYRRPLTCIDLEERPYTAFRPLCCPPEKERFLRSDWLEVDLPESFDLVLGDGSMAMLPRNSHQNLVDNLHRMLKPSGYTILRLLCQDASPFKSPEAVIHWYRDSYIGTLPLSSLRTHFMVQWLNLETLVMEPEIFAQEMENLYQRKVLTDEEYEEFKKFPLNVALTFTRKQEFESFLVNKFDIIDVDKPTDLLSGTFYPIYTLRKR
jgi:SAM-dependent methyltransferase